MNNWNQLENHLRHWTPRPPSPRLRQQLFAQPAPRTARWIIRPALGWLMPALGALILAALVACQDNPQAQTRSHPLLASGFANWVSEYESSLTGERNVLTKNLEWTNAGPSRSSMGFFILYNTNSSRY